MNNRRIWHQPAIRIDFFGCLLLLSFVACLIGIFVLAVLGMANGG